MDLEATMQSRRKAVMESIQQIPLEKLKALESQIFPYPEHPWREPFEAFLKETTGCVFHHANAGEGIQIVYCHAKDKGLWFIPKSGLGFLQPKGLQIMKEAVDKPK